MCAPVLPVQHSQLHVDFLAALPRIETHLRVAFRGIRCRHHRADMIAEGVALCWRWFQRLNDRGKDATKFVSAVADFAARHVRAGRRLCGQDSAKDALSPRAQAMHAFKVERLPSSTAISHHHLYSEANGQRLHDEFEERLADNTVTPPDEQAMFRVDFKAWLKTLTSRERRLVRAMALDERTRDLASTFKVTPGRISQLRAEFRDGWRRFCGELPPREALASTGSAA